MCKATVDAPVRDPGPETIRTSSNSRENSDPVALGISHTTAVVSMGLPVAERIQLQLLTEIGEGAEFDLTKSLTTIGRAGGGADIEIDDPEVSRSHCAIEVRQDGILLHDLRSTNGTYLRGSPITVIRLAPMSIFRIGTSHLRVKSVN
jgi:pSer/pThr/pTyr-binding forkhead associated (FHA) protein